MYTACPSAASQPFTRPCRRKGGIEPVVGLPLRIPSHLVASEPQLLLLEISSLPNRTVFRFFISHSWYDLLLLSYLSHTHRASRLSTLCTSSLPFASPALLRECNRCLLPFLTPHHIMFPSIAPPKLDVLGLDPPCPSATLALNDGKLLNDSDDPLTESCPTAQVLENAQLLDHSFSTPPTALLLRISPPLDDPNLPAHISSQLLEASSNPASRPFNPSLLPRPVRSTPPLRAHLAAPTPSQSWPPRSPAPPDRSSACPLYNPLPLWSASLLAPPLSWPRSPHPLLPSYSPALDSSPPLHFHNGSTLPIVSSHPRDLSHNAASMMLPKLRPRRTPLSA